MGRPAYLYLAILFVNAKWMKAAPDVRPTQPGMSNWALSNAAIDAPMRTDPTIRYILRRIRKSLGHARIEVNWPAKVAPTEIPSKVTLIFHDVNMRDRKDTFRAELTLLDAFNLARQYHVAAGELIAKTYGVVPVYDVGWNPQK